jgi:hypothetical protein
MKTTSFTFIAAAVLVPTLFTAPLALAGGEHKMENQSMMKMKSTQGMTDMSKMNTDSDKNKTNMQSGNSKMNMQSDKNMMMKKK